MKFVIYDATGNILRTGACPDGEEQFQAQSDEFLLLGAADVHKDAVNPQTQQVVPGGRVIPPAPPLTYDRARRQMYPRLEEQLDMLWHGMDATPAKRIEPFYSVIKAVKDANPKPQTGTVFDVGSI